jgi:hypothetical protein
MPCTWSALRRAAAAAGLFAVVVATGPAARAEGQGDYGPVELREREAGLMKTANEYEELFLRRGFRYTEPELEEAVSRIGASLAPAPTDAYIRYRFHILRDPEVNAFALPDGQVYVNTGLLALLDNEAQLAAVLAHEVHHTAGHHAILAYRSVRRKIVTGMVLGPFTLGLSDIFLELSVLGYSRDLESEADLRGERRMVEAGYDPREMARVFEILQEDPEEERPKTSTAWSDHPALEERVTVANELTPGLLTGRDPAALRVEAAGYRRLVRRVALATVGDLAASDYPLSAVALAKRLVKEDASDPMRQLLLGDALRDLGARPETVPAAATNRAKKKNVKARARMTREEREQERLAAPGGKEHLAANLAAAAAAYRRALALDADFPEAHRGLGLALLDRGEALEAGRELVLYLKARPQADDRPLILDRLKTINETIRKGDPHDVRPSAP